MVPLVLLGVIHLVSGLGAVTAAFIDLEQSTGNRLVTVNWWDQTSQAEFNGGVLNQVDISASPGDVKLESGTSWTLVASDNSEVSTSGDLNWHLMKTLNFTKSGGDYDDLRVDTSIKAEKTGTTVCGIQIDDEIEANWLTHSTTSVTYVNFQDFIDFASYPDGAHAIKLHLKQSKKAAKLAYNLTFELYRGETGYSSPGTLASQKYSSGVTGNAYSELQWSETLAAGTDITFEVRASDSNFAEDAEFPTWVDLGTADSPVSLSVVGKYFQWRATLTTSDTAVTPTLHDVTAYFPSTS